MKKNCFKSFLSLALVVLGLAMPSNAMADTWDGTALSDVGTVSETSPIYLYNEAAQAWFNVGGLWGTQAVTNKDYGISIITFTKSGSYYKMETALENGNSEESGQGRYIGHVLFHTGTAAVDNGLYCDRYNGDVSKCGVTSFTFTEVNSTTHEYTISCVTGSKTYYITAPATLRDSCKMITSPTEYSNWKIVTKQTIDEKMQENPATWDDPTNITYVISDANLFRGSTHETAWATSSDWNVLSTTQDITTPEAVTSVTSGQTYYISDGTNYLTLSSSGSLGTTNDISSATEWTFTESGDGYTISNGSYYLTTNQSSSSYGWYILYRNSLYTSSTSSVWSFDNGKFYKNLKLQATNNRGSWSYDYADYYLTYNSGWTLSTTAPSASTTYNTLGTKTISAEGLKFGGQYYKRTCGGSYEDKTSDNPDETINATNTYQRARGKYFGGQVRGASGKVAQTVKVYYSGWYEVSCQGAFYNPTKTANNVAYIFANANGTEVTSAFDRVSSDEWDAIQDKFFTKDLYKTTVQIKVVMDNPNAKGYDANGKEISIGVLLKAANAQYADWTAFDDFQIEFLGANTELILKENTTDYSYLKNTTTTFENCTMYLNRTFTEGKWNTLVLPVALNKSQFIGAFGASARAAYLDHVESGILHFVTIKKNGKDDDDAFMKANTPYIVYIQSNPSETSEQKVRYDYVDENNKPYTTEYTIGGSDEPYYTVPFVTLNKANIQSNIGALGQSEADATDKEEGRTNGKYTITDQDNSNRSVTFDGTLLKTYNGSAIRTDYLFDNMVGNLIFKGGVMYYITADYGMKAYRAWLKPNNYVSQSTETGEGGSEELSKISFSIDGVEDSATDIYELNVDKNTSSAQKYQSGVYGINGQMISKNASIENLPKGIYIVNGKKYIVK